MFKLCSYISAAWQYFAKPKYTCILCGKRSDDPNNLCIPLELGE